MSYDILLFDADDTLFDFRTAEKLALESTLAEYGVGFNDSVLGLYHEFNRRMWLLVENTPTDAPFPWHSRFENLFAALSLEMDARAVNNTYMSNLALQAVLLPGVPELCERLRRTHRLFIITNGRPSAQRSRLALSGISHCFEDVFISGEIGFRKPDTEFFRYTAEHIPGFAPERTLVIGDSLTSDISGGIRAGLDTCWFNPRGEIAPEALRPTYEIQSLGDIFSII